MGVVSKQWVVQIVSPQAGHLAILRDGVPLPARIGPGLTTPVEVLLVSIGTCFALSCHAAFATLGIPRVEFQVSVTGRKAPQPPTRLTDIDLQVIFDASLSPELAHVVATSAEKLCTVTNTLTSQPAIRMEVSGGAAQTGSVIPRAGG